MISVIKNFNNFIKTYVNVISQNVRIQSWRRLCVSINVLIHENSYSGVHNLKAMYENKNSSLTKQNSKG